MGRRTDQVKTDGNRTEQLKAVTAEFGRVHDDWCDDKNRMVPDEIYWDAVDSLLESFDNGDIPGECRKLADAVAKFSEAVDAFDDRDNAKQLYPEDSFWLAREGVTKALADFTPAAKELPPLESIASLAVLPAMTLEQICRIWGFLDKHRNPLTHLVKRELDKPGSVIDAPDGVDGRKWRDPRLPVEDGNAIANQRVKAISEKRRASAKASAPCPESPKELWEQKVSVSQASRMLCRSESEVAELFGKLDEEREQALLSGDVLDANTQAARELKDAGKTIGQIAETLGMTEKQVAEALKRKSAA